MKKITDLVEGEHYSTVGSVILAITELEMEFHAVRGNNEKISNEET